MYGVEAREQAACRGNSGTWREHQCVGAVLPTQRIFPGGLQAACTLVVRMCVPFDLACTQAYAEIVAKARAAGLAIATADGYIAATAAANGFAVATRDSTPFKAAGVTVINPWQA